MSALRPLASAACLLIAATAVSAPQAHMVFFTLAEPSEANRDRLVAGCQRHLANHEGVLHFSVGVLSEDLSREVNDKSFHVALHLVFDSRESHDTYQKHARHLAFIKQNRKLWSQVKVFDSDLVKPSPAPETD